jgi:hypothetical protein
MTTRFLPIPWSSSRRGPGCTASLDERLYIDNRTLGLTSPSIHPWLEGWCPQIAAEAQRWIARPRHAEDGGRDPPPPPCPVWPARAPAHTPAGPKVNLAREGFKDRREKNSFLLTMEIELRSLTNTCCSFTATITERPRMSTSCTGPTRSCRCLNACNRQSAATEVVGGKKSAMKPAAEWAIFGPCVLIEWANALTVPFEAGHTARLAGLLAGH